MKDDEQSMCNHADREWLKILVFGMREKTDFLYRAERRENTKEKRKDKRGQVFAKGKLAEFDSFLINASERCGRENFNQHSLPTAVGIQCLVSKHTCYMNLQHAYKRLLI